MESRQARNWLAEKQYIDCMLGVDAASVEEPAAEDGAAAAKDAPAKLSAEAADRMKANLYQLVEVAGIKLAIPLEEILQAAELCEAGDGGVLRHRGESYRVVDLRSLIRPDAPVSGAETCMLIRGRHIAIPCERILDMHSIDGRIVCWKDECSRRSWLAGTVREQCIAILDLAGIEEVVASQT